MNNHTTDFGRGLDYRRPIQPGYSPKTARLLELRLMQHFNLAPKPKKNSVTYGVSEEVKQKVLKVLSAKPQLAKDIAEKAEQKFRYTHRILSELQRQGLVNIEREKTRPCRNFYTLVRRKC